ncbi:TIGR04282 family arsenosugar biosynthesis glycosyltransferase [Streptomyces sp. NPDC001435]|uniref:TIGR04282 family arsenosugar biosynthesis glycosyltransferase n=1 Tax=unclassified Streptomyces TaxID=2593676 RepID=UPI00369AB4AD
MMATTAPAVLIMAKPPRPGTVKTRLHPLLGPQRCAHLQAQLIEHALDTARSTGHRTYLAYAPADHPSAHALGPPLPAGTRTLCQRGTDLGERLTLAVTDAFADGAGPLLVIGTDAPTLTRDHLIDALSTLESRDAVLGPALDGGYYLIGMGAPHTELFALDPAWWSTDKVLTTTLELAGEAGLRTGLLAPLRDLDTPEDAAEFLVDPALPSRIAAVLASPQSREDV